MFPDVDQTRVQNAATTLLYVFDCNTRTRPDVEGVKISSLTAREREIVLLASTGLNRQQIADKLFLSDGTVRNHLSSIFSKLEVPNHLALVFYAQRHGLDKPYGLGLPG